MVLIKINNINDPYKLTSTQSWRSNVLLRLYEILMIVSNSTTDDSAESKGDDGQLIKLNELNECVF